MITHRVLRTLPIARKTLFEVAADVPSYPTFLPWIRHVSILAKSADSMTAQLHVRFGPLHECFTSHVQWTPCSIVSASSQSGPLRSLKCDWRFLPAARNSDTTIDFCVAFALRSPLAQHAARIATPHASAQMIAAFENRAQTLHQMESRS